MMSVQDRQKQADSSIYARELCHRTSNLLQQALAALHFAARGRAQLLPAAIDRLSGAADLQQLLAPSDNAMIDLCEHLRVVCAAVCKMTGAQDTVKFVLDGSPLHVAGSVARVIAMAVSEVVGNAIRHGIANRIGGSVILTVRDEGERTTISVDDDGPGGGGWSRPGGQGCGIVDALIGELGGEVRRERLKTGLTRVRMDMVSLATPAHRQIQAECRSCA